MKWEEGQKKEANQVKPQQAAWVHVMGKLRKQSHLRAVHLILM